MLKIIFITEIVISLALIVSILLQNRGSGLSQAFGGGMGGYYTKRGLEKFLVYLSVGLSVAFIGLALTSVYISHTMIS
jgi:preprotein translocase subunit SecG